MSGSPCASCPNLPRQLQSPDPDVLLAHGLTPTRLAALLGVSRSTTSRWFKAGHIPASARFDVAKELLAAVHGGPRHE